MAIMTLPQSAIAYSHLTPMDTPKVIHMAKAIATDGLLNPIVVAKTEDSGPNAARAPYRLIDGGKRLHAINLLGRAHRLPRSLHLVPCLEQSSTTEIVTGRPALKTDSEFVHAICAAFASGANKLALMARFDCTSTAVDQALSLGNLHPQIMDYFASGHLSLEQAAAFATLPNQDAQWNLLQELGPFAHAADVISAILNGETVLPLPNGEHMILPSRAPHIIQAPRHAIETRFAA